MLKNNKNSQFNNKQYLMLIISKNHSNELNLKIKNGIQSNIRLKKQSIFKKHLKLLSSCMKYGNQKIKQILQARNNSIIKNNSYHIQKEFKYENKNMKNKILGGGCRICRYEMDILQKMESKMQKQQLLDDQLLQDYKSYTNKKLISQNIDTGIQLQMQLQILQSLLLHDAKILDDISQYKNKLVEIIDVFLIYLLSGSSEIELLQLTEIDKLGSLIKEMKKSFDKESDKQPCIDLSFYFDILDKLNSNRVGKDTQNKSSLQKVSEFISNIVKLGVGKKQCVQGEIISTIKIALQETDYLLETYKQQKSYYFFTFLLDNWRRKWIQFENKIWELTLEQELDFYLNQLYELCCNNEQQNELILLTLIKIDYLFSTALEEENRLFIAEIFPFNNQQIIKILPFLMQQGDYQHNLEFISFTVQNSTYRFLAISILLKYYQIISSLNNFIDQKEDMFIYLCYKYLCEKNKSVKLVYEANKQFLENFDQKIEDEKFKEKILSTSYNIRQYLSSILKLQSYENTIDKIDDIDRIADIILNQYQRNNQKRQKENDTLFEIQDVYIQQYLTFLEGNLIFKEILTQSISSSQINENRIDTIKLNALQILTDIFLQDNCVLQDAHDEQNDELSKCKILGILAEEGTGKSMLLKQLELYLIENQNSNNQSQINKNYIPLIIKCNSLDPIDPSIEQYLKQQGKDQEQIDSLKYSTDNKVILMDGFDEYTGEYFRLYEKLNLIVWEKTKIIVTSRKQKLLLSEACFNFSIDNYNGQRDESSFCILKLEEFKEQDSLDYCEKYFRQQRTNQDNQFDEIQYLKDMNIIKDTMKYNKQLKNLLYLPININLFSRIIIILKNEQQIQAIIKSITDQISLQEILFKEYFKREAQDLIKSVFDLQKIEDEITNTYFEYYQAAAMQMFLNKGKMGVVNFLQIQKDKIETSMIKNLKQNISLKLQKSFIIKIITQTNSNSIIILKEERIINQNGQEKENVFIQFKHTYLYEYFVARAMKYDFEINGNNIYNLPIENLSEFQINRKLIMNIGKNQSEQQILINLYKLIKKEIESYQFYQNYHENQIEKNNKYIQYLKRSQIQSSENISQIDVGASNLISAMFISKFSYSKLNLSLCSFSKAYICDPKSNQINFDRCNFQFAYLNNSHINFDTCNTESAIFDSYTKIFDSSNIYSFIKAIWGKNNILYSISKFGFINAFENIGLSVQLQKSKQLSQTSLSNILILNDDSLLVSSKYALFLIDSNSFEIKQFHNFTIQIINISLFEKSILVTLQNQNLLKGTFDEGFQSLKIIASGSIFNKTQKILVTYLDNFFSLWDTKKNFKNIKTIQGHTKQISFVIFSFDEKYFATGSSDGTCKIWNAEQGFKLIQTINGYSDYIFSIAFSVDGKKFAIGNKYGTYEIIKVEEGLFSDQNNNKLERDGNQVICSLGFSQDGKYLATVSTQNVCKIWEFKEKSTIVNTIQGFSDDISSIIFSDDGKFLATGSNDNTCKIWYVEKGFELIKTIQGHTDYIISVAFSASNKYFATGSSDKTCIIWNPNKNFELIKILKKHSDSVLSISFSSDEKYLATGSQDDTCKIWNIEKGYLIITIRDHIDYIRCVAFSADGKYLATGSYDKTCKIWSVENGFQHSQTIRGHTQKICSVSFSANGKYLATGSYDNTCKIWSVENYFELINTIKGHSSTYTYAIFSAKGKYLATSSYDNTCKLWNPDKGFELINTIQYQKVQILSIAFSSNEKCLAIASNDKALKIWNIEKGFDLINTKQSQTDLICSASFSADGRYLATGSNDKTCKLWNTDKGFELVYTIQGHSGYIWAVAFSEDSKYLATGSNDNTCKIWNLEKSCVLVNTIKDHNNYILSVAFSACGKYLATGSNDNTCKVWNVEKSFENINTIQSHTKSISSVTFSEDGKYLATGSWDNTCKIWNSEKGFELIKTINGHRDAINSVVFSKNGKFLVSGSNDNTCKIWDVQKDYQLIYTLKDHTDSIFTVAFSADGMYLVTGSMDNTCKIWNAEKKFQIINTISNTPQQICSVAFSLNGNYISICTKDKVCKIWNFFGFCKNLYVL